MTTPPNTQEPALADCKAPNICDVMEAAWARNKARRESPIMARDLVPIWSRGTVKQPDA